MSSTNAVGAMPASSRVNGSTTTASTPASASSSSRRAIEVSIRGARFGASSAEGCGSKVSATVSASLAAASSRARAISARWPRWTPSKLPIAIAAPRHAGALR